MRFFLLATFLLGKAYAQELPSEFITAHSYTDLFRAALVTKLAQMDQNFIRSVVGDELYYQSTKEVLCPGGKSARPGQKLLRLQYHAEVNDKLVSERRSYYGCDGNVAFTETYQITGTGIKPHAKADVFSGKMDFRNIDQADSLNYELRDGEGRAVFGVNYRKDQKMASTVFSVATSRFLRSQITQVDGKRIVRYFSYPLEFFFSQNDYTLEAKGSAMFKNYVGAVLTSDNTWYHGPSKERVSMAQFQGLFHFHWSAPMMEALLAYFPETKFVTSGMRNSKMLEELRNAQTFLISGTQLNLVRNLVEEYIKAVQEGAIVDNRK